jgi:hypothetical protein
MPPATLFWIVLCLTVSVPLFRMPPPLRPKMPLPYSITRRSMVATKPPMDTSSPRRAP